MTKEVKTEKTIIIEKETTIDIDKLTDKIEDFFVDEEVPDIDNYTFGDLKDDDYYSLLVLIGKTLIKRYDI